MTNLKLIGQETIDSISVIDGVRIPEHKPTKSISCYEGHPDIVWDDLDSTLFKKSMNGSNLEIDSVKNEIQQLIRKLYNWQEAQKPSENEMISDAKDSLYLGFNLVQLEKDILELKASNLFANEFITNYRRIYTTLDEQLKTKKIEWLVGDLPPFGNDANPWCNCQDVPYDQPNPWDLIEVEKIQLDKEKGEFVWKWGKLESNTSKEWFEAAYKFRVVKENGKWKIAYLEGFDFIEFTRSNE